MVEVRAAEGTAAEWMVEGGMVAVEMVEVARVAEDTVAGV